MSLSPVSRKEARELAPYFIGAVATLLLISMTIHQDAAAGTITLRVLCWAIVYVAACLVAVWPISSEFGHSTMARLLAQPVPRAQIWRQKFGWSALAIGLLLLATLVGTWALLAFEAAKTASFIFGLMAATALTTGAFMAVYLRQTLTALLATMIMPFLGMIVAALLSDLSRSAFGVDLYHGKYEVAQNVSIATVLPLLAWSVLAYVLARRRFLKLEV